MFRYFGSKSSNASYVADIAMEHSKPITVADAFGGLGNMGVEFKKRGCKVTTCDLLEFPHLFQYSRIVCQQMPSFIKVRKKLGLNNTNELLDILNRKDNSSDWFVREYSINRQFFTTENAKIISSAWRNISNWHKEGLLTDNEKKFALASLINSADSYANTAGTYYAYLKNWHRKAIRNFQMKWIPIQKGKFSGTAFKGDALDCLKGKKFDLLYLDPPYNGRDYSRYYHLPETLTHLRSTKIDKDSISGQPLKRSCEGENIRSAMKADYILELIHQIKWKKLFFHYADGAYIPTSKINKMLKNLGDLYVYKFSAPGYRTNTGNRKINHYLYVIYKK